MGKKRVKRATAYSSRPHTQQELQELLTGSTTCLEIALERARAYIERVTGQKSGRSMRIAFAEGRREVRARDQADLERFSIALARAIWRFVPSCSSANGEADNVAVEAFHRAWKHVLHPTEYTRSVLRYGLVGHLPDADIYQAAYGNGDDEDLYRLLIFWAASECDSFASWSRSADRASMKFPAERWSNRLSRRTREVWAYRQTSVDVPTEIAARDWETDALRLDVEKRFPDAEDALIQEGYVPGEREDESYRIPRLCTIQSTPTSTDRTRLTDEALTLLARIARHDPAGKKALGLYEAWVEKMRDRPKMCA